MAVVPIAPEAAMDDDGDTDRSAILGTEQLGVLTWMGAVGVNGPHEA
jgi:hypothetical protein